MYSLRSINFKIQIRSKVLKEKNCEISVHIKSKMVDLGDRLMTDTTTLSELLTNLDVICKTTYVADIAIRSEEHN